MTLTKGMLVSDIAARVATDLKDPTGKRFSTDQIIAFINDGIRELANGDVFQRTDLRVPVASTPFYSPFAEHRIIKAAEYNGKSLIGATVQELTDTYGQKWREQTGTPTHFVADRQGIRLYPAPVDGGTTLTFGGTGAMTEAAGGTVTGDGYTAAYNSGTALLVHFKDGDGNVTNAETAGKNLRYSYTYFPTPSQSGDTIPARYVDALLSYALFRAFNLSEAPEEVARAQNVYAQWISAREELITNSPEEKQSQAQLFAPMRAP